MSFEDLKGRIPELTNYNFEAVIAILSDEFGPKSVMSYVKSVIEAGPYIGLSFDQLLSLVQDLIKEDTENDNTGNINELLRIQSGSSILDLSSEQRAEIDSKILNHIGGE